MKEDGHRAWDVWNNAPPFVAASRTYLGGMLPALVGGVTNAGAEQLAFTFDRELRAPTPAAGRRLLRQTAEAGRTAIRLEALAVHGAARHAV